MKPVTLLLLTPLLASACGSSPAAPTPAQTTVPRAISFGLQFVPDSVTGQGWFSPTTVTLRPAGMPAAATVEKAAFRMLDERGEALAEASVAINGPIPPDGYMDGQVVVQTLKWAPERGFAKRFELTLEVRTSSGELSTITTSFAAR